MLDALDLGVLALDGHNRPVLLNRTAQVLLKCPPDGSMLPRPLLDLAAKVWRSGGACTRELLIGKAVLRLHAARLEDNVLVQVHDVSLLRHLQQAHRSLVAAVADALLERVEGPALLVEALASVDDPALARHWLERLRGDVAALARLVGDPQDPRQQRERPAASPPRSPAASSGGYGGWAAEDSVPDSRRPTLLLVEPVSVVADAMTIALSEAGFDTVATTDPLAALEVIKVAEPDCVLVDLGQHADSAAVAGAGQLREATSVPMVLLVSADADAPMLPQGMVGAATTVLRRPLRLRELVIKTRQALAAAKSDSLKEGDYGLLVGGDVVLDTRAHTVWVRGRQVPMSLRERQLLHVLLQHPGRVLSHEKLLKLAWGSDANGCSLGAYLLRLRRKIERDPSRPEHIITLRGIGVRFEPPGAPNPDEQ